jgi:hypothetical protein
MIRAVKITHCVNVTNEAIIALTFTCRQLTHLWMSHIYNLRDSGVQSVAKNCLKMEHLDISMIDALTDDSLQYIGEDSVFLCALLDKRYKWCRSFN